MSDGAQESPKPPPKSDVHIHLNTDTWMVQFTVRQPLAIHPFVFAMPMAQLKHAMGQMLMVEAQVELALQQRLSGSPILPPHKG